MSDPLFDVIVVGGGPSGFGAAMGAAQAGAKVALVERHPMLGGMGTAGLVTCFSCAHWDLRRIIIGGAFGQIRNRLLALNAVYVTGGAEPFDPAIYAREMRLLCERAGVTLMLNSTITGCDITDQRGTLTLKDGSRLAGKAVVDATGDALVAARAGVPFDFGRDGDHAVMPCTFCYIVGPVDVAEQERDLPETVYFYKNANEKAIRLSGQPKVVERFMKAREVGDLRELQVPCALGLSIPGRPHELGFNFGRVHVKDPTDPQQLRDAEAKGRVQIDEGIAFLRKYFPAFKNAKVIETALQIGVRESRHIQGLFQLTKEHFFGQAQFDDVIAQCRYPIDIHEPGSFKTTMIYMPDGTHYDIPWRCLVPKEGPANLLVAGRAISATHEAASSFRVSPSVMAIGEAAGVGAAIAARGTNVRDIDYRDVQRVLLEHGAILE